MIFKVDPSGSLSGFRDAITGIADNKDIKGILVLSADDNGFTTDIVDPILREITTPIFGGIFPQIVNGQEKLTKGTIVIGFKQAVDVLFIEDVSTTESRFDDIIDDRFPANNDAKTMFVFVDGFSRRVGSLIESLFNIFGLELNYIGGGAGSIHSIAKGMKQLPCIFTNQGMKKDCAVLAMLELNSGIGVRHGWDIVLSGPHRVTESEGNRIKTIDWKPAFDVYEDIIRTRTDQTISHETFFETAKSYPFGIAKLGAEHIVRDPFGVDEHGALIFNTEIQRESFVSVLTGDFQSLIKAAKIAYEESIDPFKDQKSDLLFVVDCISRVLFLQENFALEVAATSSSETPTFGVLSIGEIANSGKDYLELYNKTCVVGCLGADE